MTERVVEVEDLANDQERLDIFLAKKFPDLSRNRIQGLIKAGSVLVDGRIISKTGTLVGGGEKIVLQESGPMILELKKGLTYGAVRSRRLGRSLGINLFPGDEKRCPFDCVYCQ